MNRRTILKRIGETAAVTAGLSGVGAATGSLTGGGGGTAARIDVSGVSGTVALSSLVEDPAAALPDEYLAQLPDGVEASDVRLMVDADTDGVGVDDIKCNVGCCSGSTCPSECDACYCNPCPIIA